LKTASSVKLSLVMKSDAKQLSETGFTVLGYRYERLGKLEGKILTIIDAIGLDENQNKAVKDLVRNEISEIWNKPEYIFNYGEFDGENKLIVHEGSFVVYGNVTEKEV